MPGQGEATLPVQSIEGRASWIAAGVTLAILSVAYGSTLLVVVGLRVMERDLGLDRSALALAGALTWLGTGLGGVLMGWVADRIGVRATVSFGAAMILLRPGAVRDRPSLGNLPGPRRADRPLRHGRDLPATGDVCEPLVRPPPRHRHRPHRVRPIRRGGRLAGRVRLVSGRSRLARRLFWLCVRRPRLDDPACAACSSGRRQPRF